MNDSRLENGKMLDHAGIVAVVDSHDDLLLSQKIQYMRQVFIEAGGNPDEIPVDVLGKLGDGIALWRAHIEVKKFEGEWSPEKVPYEVVEHDTNLLMYGGVSCLWQCLIGNGTGTAAQTLTFFNNGNAYLGVGDSTTAESASHTDLQAASNKLRKAMDATYPTHTDGVVVGAASIVFRSTFATGDANFVWNEWAIFNGSSGGRMLNRKQTNLGTKTSASSWQLTATLTLS